MHVFHQWGDVQLQSEGRQPQQSNQLAKCLTGKKSPHALKEKYANKSTHSRLENIGGKNKKKQSKQHKKNNKKRPEKPLCTLDNN